VPGEAGWLLTVSACIPDAGGEVPLFLDWVAPYLELRQGEVFGWVIGPEDDDRSPPRPVAYVPSGYGDAAPGAVRGGRLCIAVLPTLTPEEAGWLRLEGEWDDEGDVAHGLGIAPPWDAMTPEERREAVTASAHAFLAERATVRASGTPPQAAVSGEGGLPAMRLLRAHMEADAWRLSWSPAAGPEPPLFRPGRAPLQSGNACPAPLALGR
jgi:hypothetical protein